MRPTGTERAAHLEGILNQITVAITHVDAQGNIRYANAAAIRRPSKMPWEIGRNIRDCHAEASNEKIAAIFKSFASGRREPHHYVNTANGQKELVTMIPMFEGNIFSGCISQTYPLEMTGPERSF